MAFLDVVSFRSLTHSLTQSLRSFCFACSPKSIAPALEMGEQTNACLLCICISPCAFHLIIFLYVPWHLFCCYLSHFIPHLVFVGFVQFVAFRLALFRMHIYTQTDIHIFGPCILASIRWVLLSGCVWVMFERWNIIHLPGVLFLFLMQCIRWPHSENSIHVLVSL